MSKLPFWVLLHFQVANKLYPLPSVAQQIEDFANEMLLSVIGGAHGTDRAETEGSNTELQKVFTLCFIKFFNNLAFHSPSC